MTHSYHYMNVLTKGEHKIFRGIFQGWGKENKPNCGVQTLSCDCKSNGAENTINNDKFYNSKSSKL